MIFILISQKKNMYHLGEILSSVDLFGLVGCSCFFYRVSNLLFCRFCSVFCRVLWSLESCDWVLKASCLFIALALGLEIPCQKIGFAQEKVMKGGCSWNSKSGEMGFGLPWAPSETLQAAVAMGSLEKGPWCCFSLPWGICKEEVGPGWKSSEFVMDILVSDLTEIEWDFCLVCQVFVMLVSSNCGTSWSLVASTLRTPKILNSIRRYIPSLQRGSFEDDSS